MALEIAQVPFRSKQDHPPLLPVDGNDALPSGGRHWRCRIFDPARRRVSGRRDFNRYAVLGAETTDDYLILQRPDDADDRFALPGTDVEHLHQAFFFELSQSLIELFVAR